MPRPRSGVCLQNGLKLDLNILARKGFVQRGCYSGVRGIRWTHSYEPNERKFSLAARHKVLALHNRKIVFLSTCSAAISSRYSAGPRVRRT